MQGAQADLQQFATNASNRAAMFAGRDGGRNVSDQRTHIWRAMETAQATGNTLTGVQMLGECMRVCMCVPQMLALLEEIRRNAQRFKRPPVGPIGMYLGLNDTRCVRQHKAARGVTPVQGCTYVDTNFSDYSPHGQQATTQQLQHGP